ncbi:hypothetical protein [Yinghuangia seranimata]|uniref:hypothetical protein n=1 Tax=Yinghuangia seranimata TaxID=408067 RepID=UPI00248BF446|nr:hypothetical protein [Yinghuangia seranimata]MDI2128857.1 hypothetical protein [Yinghuangia seranimata]
MDASVLQCLMRSSVDDLPPLPDLVPGAIALGIRLRRRSRLLVAANAICAIIIGAVTVPALLTGNTDTPKPASSPSSPPSASPPCPQPRPAAALPAPPCTSTP